MTVQAARPRKLTQKEELWLNKKVAWGSGQGLVTAVLSVPAPGSKRMTMLRVLRDDNGKLLQEPESIFKLVEE